MQRPDEKLNFGLLIDYQINNNHQIKTSYFRMNDETTAGLDYSLLFRETVSIPCANPFLSTQQIEKLCTDFGLINSDSQSVILSRRNFEGSPREQFFDLTNERFVFDLNGNLRNNWKYNFFIQRSITDLNYIYFNDISKSKTANALNISEQYQTQYVLVMTQIVFLGTFYKQRKSGCFKSILGVTQELLDYINLDLSIYGSSNESQYFISFMNSIPYENDCS